MGFLQRLFGIQRPAKESANPGVPGQQVGVPNPGQQVTTQMQAPQSTGSIPPERVGLDGGYDQSGLAKRVALAFDQNSAIADVDTVYVAQRGSTVVLKGQVPDRGTLETMIETAKKVHGATAVETNEVNLQ